MNRQEEDILSYLRQIKSEHSKKDKFFVEVEMTILENKIRTYFQALSNAEKRYKI
jgi:hypothetical protein